MITSLSRLRDAFGCSALAPTSLVLFLAVTEGDGAIASQGPLHLRSEPAEISSVCVAVLLDGTPIVGRSDGLIVALDSATGATRDVFARHAGAVVYLAVDPKGELVAASGQDGRVGVWRIKCEPQPWDKVEHRYPGYNDNPVLMLSPEPEIWRGSPSIEWTVDGEHLVVGTARWSENARRLTTQIWTRAGELIWTTEQARGVALHPLEQRLAYLKEGKVVLGWPGAGWKFIDRPGATKDVSFSPDGRRLVVTGDDYQIWLLNPEDGSIENSRSLEGHELFPGKSPYVHLAEWSPSGDFLAACFGLGHNHVILQSDTLETIWLGGPRGGRASEIFEPFWTPTGMLVTGFGEVEVVDPAAKSAVTFETGYDPHRVAGLPDTGDCLLLSNGLTFRLAQDGRSMLWVREERAQGGSLRRHDLTGKGKARNE